MSRALSLAGFQVTLIGRIWVTPEVKLSGGRIVEATIKAVVETTEGVRLQVSFGDDTALIYPWQIIIEAR
jgi:hypothetical protein